MARGLVETLGAGGGGAWSNECMACDLVETLGGGGGAGAMSAWLAAWWRRCGAWSKDCMAVYVSALWHLPGVFAVL